MSNSLDPDQARHFVGPDLGPNCLQWLSADNTICNVVGNDFFESKIVIIFLPISLNICFGYSKEPSH